jgi:uncharacterized protein (TIGR00297 family)
LKTLLTLDFFGFFIAVVMGLLIFVFGGSVGIWFLLVILLFLIVSALVTRFKKRRKIAMKTYEHSRNWKNVLANGMVPLIISFIYFLNEYKDFVSAEMLVVAYVASVAAITADKFSSEVGILDNRVYDILTLKRIKPGKSGGVSFLGLAAGALGAFIMGVVLFSFSKGMLLLLIVMVAGMVGDVGDSVLGYFEERGFGNKYTSNFACATIGAAVGILLVATLL